MTAVSSPTSAPAVGSPGAGPAAVPPFAVIPGAQVRRMLQGREGQIVELVEATYRLHGAGDSVNPPSYFLRFPDRPASRIIALPASIGGPHQVDGLKWISSFPQNVAAGIPRASAVLILNDHDTGYPFACLESSIISATRTAASAALAADWLSRGRGADSDAAARAGAVGRPDRVLRGRPDRPLHPHLPGRHRLDVRRDRRARLVRRQRGRLPRLPGAVRHGTGGGSGAGGRITVHDRAEDLIRSSDLVVFATIAGQPHVSDPSWFGHNPLVLHVSLRDLAPEILLASANIVDDVEHCLKASTSPHLAEQLTGNRDFLLGTLDDVMSGRVTRAGGPAGRVLALRPGRARPRGRQVRLRRGRPLRRAARHRRVLPRAAPLRLTRRAAAP